jgi:hypothetical protein
VYSTHLIEQQSPRQHVHKPVPAEIWATHVCVRILGDQLVGPVVLPNRLTDAVYHHFLANDLPVFLEHVPLHQ